MHQRPEDEQHREELEQRNPSSYGTMEFWVRRMRRKGDLPTFSLHIMDINDKLSSLTAIHQSSTGDLANILR